MKFFSVALFSLICLLFSCKNDAPPPVAPPSTADELRELRAQLQKKSAELQDKQQIAEAAQQLKNLQNQIDKMDGVAPKETPPQVKPVPLPAASGKYKINASSVVMRSGSSAQADKIGSFNMGEVVQVISIVDAENPNEGILREDTELSSNGQSVVLPAGKAVLVERYDQKNEVATVSYQHSTKGKLSAEISGSAIDLISFSRWYQVKRANGETGWVFGKFLSSI